MPAADVGAALRRWRHRKGLTLDAVAARTSMTIVQLSQIERGLRKPNSRTVARLEGGLGWPPGFFHELAAVGDDPDLLDNKIAGIGETPPRVQVSAGVNEPAVVEGYAERMLEILDSFIRQLPEPNHPTFGYAVAAALEQCGKAQVLASKSWRMTARGDRQTATRLLAMLADLETKRVGLLEQVPNSVGAQFERACARSGLSEVLVGAMTGLSRDELWEIRCGGAVPEGANIGVAEFIKEVGADGP